MQNIDPAILDKARLWLGDGYDEKTRESVRKMIDGDPKELIDAFYRDLEFGTGGLRGVMGVGSNRMNRYTVGAATQGLANYIRKQFQDHDRVSVAIAHDSRNNSAEFAKIAADIFSANNIFVYLFDALRPTPELSFAIRQLECQAGIVITASHNPKEYNGYKVYWDDGGQLVPPHDENVIAEVGNVCDVAKIKFKPVEQNIQKIGEEIDRAYLNALYSLRLNPEVIAKQADLKIVFTPIHGTGTKLVPQCLRKFGFNNIITIPEQEKPDGNFPTVKSPNPEEPAALALAMQKAVEVDADILMGTDPDADRVGIAVKNDKGEFVLLNGNQTASLLVYYMITESRNKGLLKGNEYIVKTIVTTRLLDAIAQKNEVECLVVLTGFKYIAEAIRKNEGVKRFLVGGEESYGYLAGEYVRDKDAVLACALIAEMAAWAKENGITLYRLLNRIYTEYGMFREGLLSITKKGMEGAAEIQTMMTHFRQSPPEAIAGSRVIRIADYQTSIERNCLSGELNDILLPKSNVIQIFTDDDSVVTIRPSGTEPKIKFYFGVKGEMQHGADPDLIAAELDRKISVIISDLKLQ
ncbi:MAG: phospho-sugar mutase [Bacteroidetes bacterium]|nr:phospho-sugar mutase [Bacteroidota bacterium]MBU1719935.1 phospho-sugar mutase [Bacteroidota bacterium]